MNADVEKAVDMVHVVITSSHLPGWKENRANWAVVNQALRDQEAEIANLRSAGQKALRANMGLRARAEKAEALLRDCDAVARRRGDKYGVCDCIDNDGQPYQSAYLAEHLGATP